MSSFNLPLNKINEPNRSNAAGQTLTGSGIPTPRPIESYLPSPPLYCTPRSNYPTNSHWDSRESRSIRPVNLDAYRYIKTAGAIQYRARKSHNDSVNLKNNTSGNQFSTLKYGPVPPSGPSGSSSSSLRKLIQQELNNQDNNTNNNYSNKLPSVSNDSSFESKVSESPSASGPSPSLPLWRSTASEFGREKTKIPITKSVRYFPKTHTFTSSFNGMMHKYYGLTTSNDENRTHRVTFFGDP